MPLLSCLRVRCIATPLRWAAPLGLACVLIGCSALPGRDGDREAKNRAAHAGDPVGQIYAGESRRDRLNDGYSALHNTLTGLAKTDTILYAKIESDPVERVVTDTTDYAGQLAGRLETLATQFPALNLDRTVTPPLISDAKSAQLEGTAKMFAPLVGQSGAQFERGLLIRLLGAVDQQRYLTRTLAREEPVPALAKIMAEASQKFADRFDEINALLEKSYYR